MSWNTSARHQLSRMDYRGAAVVVAVCIVSWAIAARATIAFAAAAPAGAQAASSVTRDEVAPKSQCVWLGFTVQELTPDISASLGLPGGGGVLVSDVDHGSPAAQVGLKPGDVIVAVDNHLIADEVDFLARVAAEHEGATITLDVWHHGHRETLFPQVAEMPERLAEADSLHAHVPADAVTARWGLAVEPLTSAMAEVFAIPPSSKGVVVTALDPRGVGAASGLETIDVIELVDGRPVGSAAELSAALAHDSGRRALLFVDRDGLTRFLTLSVDEP